MSKSTKIIAGVVAGLGIAALPLGVFAATPVEVVDTLTLNVNESCTFSAGGASVSPTDTISAGTSTTWNSSNHAFTINCNSDSYAVTAVATDLTKSGAQAHGTIAYMTNAAYTAATDPSITSDDGGWTAVLTGGDTDAAIKKVDTTNGNTIKSGHATTTDNFSVAYKAFAGKAQEQGQYTGTVTYTLTGTSS